jgi:hypothetical protein
MVTAMLLLPTTLWFLLLLLMPLVVILVFSFGERAPAGGYQPAFTFAQYLNLPGPAEGIPKHFDLGADRHGAMRADCLPLGLLPGRESGATLEDVAADFGHRAVLDKLPHPHLCLDLHPGRKGIRRFWRGSACRKCASSTRLLPCWSASSTAICR